MSDAIRSKLPTAARILLGLAFFVFGLNGFLQFAPNPPMPEEAGAFMGALAATGYMFPLIKGTEVVAGLLLLGGRFVPLALVLLAPILVNIVLFHVVLAPANMAMVFVLLALELYLAWAYRDSFRAVLQADARPTANSPAAGGVLREATATR
ncbi:MAG: DoxX family membrane protein [Myxococcota bacterium]